ncbi:MAG: hypothetical protein GX535_09765 [Xanthomonadaceae bacterium]|nr:hypothetical protein [Xanthomonadaceae bacterium]
MDSSSLHITELSQVIWFAVALAAAFIGVVMYRRSRSVIEAENTAPAPIVKASYSDAQTVRVLDSQHFDRLRKPLHLTPGQHADIFPAHPVVGPRFRISLQAISKHGAEDAAHLSVVYAGVRVSCGPLAKEVDFNEFLLPQAPRDESRCAIFHYQETSHTLEFMRIKVNAIDRSTNTVALEVVQMRGRWPGGDA